MALRAADTGHQVLATVHSANASQTVERLLTMVPPDEMAVARQELAGALVGVISQRLAMSTRKTRWPVVEILRGDAVTSKYILDGKITALADYLATGERKMQSFDMHAAELYRQGILTEAAALGAASNVDAVKFKMRAEGPQIKAV